LAAQIQGGTIMRVRGIIGSIFSVLLVLGVVAMSSSTSYSQWGNNNRNTRSYDSYPNWGGSNDLRQTALNAGFNDGTSAGQKSNARNRNYNDFNEYRKATRDYSSRLGDRSLYMRYYRIAFERGFDAQTGNTNNNNGGWNNGNNGNNGGWNNGNNGNNNGGWNNGNNGNNNGGWNNNGGTWNNGNNRSRGRNWGQYGNYGGNSNFRQTALNAGYNEGIKEGRKDRSRGPRNLNDFNAYQNANKDYNSRNGDLALYQRYYREGFENGYYDGLNGN
jgi:hypothetical protein